MSAYWNTNRVVPTHRSEYDLNSAGRKLQWISGLVSINLLIAFVVLPDLDDWWWRGPRGLPPAVVIVTSAETGWTALPCFLDVRAASRRECAPPASG
jgi:hypothetical protein